MPEDTYKGIDKSTRDWWGKSPLETQIEASGMERERYLALCEKRMKEARSEMNCRIFNACKDK